MERGGYTFMIIMINGAFGVGKTTISNELKNAVNNSMVFDPEEVGFMLRNILPVETKQLEAESGDFQDFKLWKVLTVEVAKSLILKYKSNLIVPMTIRNPEYYNFIINGFREIDDQTFHFCLTASENTIFSRLRKRGEEEGNWCYRQTKLCLKAFNEYNFEKYINTESKTVGEVVEEIQEYIKNISYIRGEL